MRETSLVYIVKDGKVLMLHRIRKKNDENHGKWIGVGGKFEQGECPEECMRREVREETGLYIDRYRYCGIVTFQNDDADTEFMHLFLVTGFHGQLKRCDEGDLEWLPVEMLTNIPHWKGDRIFLSLIFGEKEYPFFSLKLVYKDGLLIHSSLNEHNCLVTDRLILRPFLDADADAVYELAKNPAIGPAAGWPAHKNREESLSVIREVLRRPEIYAIVLRDTQQPVGAVGLQNFRIADEEGSLISYFDERKSICPACCTKTEGGLTEEKDGTVRASGKSLGEEAGQEADGSEIRFEAELGYWLGEPFQGNGLMTEACRAVLEHGFTDLGLSRIWCCYFAGNEKSATVQRRLGFHFHHTDENKKVELLGEVREEIVNVMFQEEWPSVLDDFTGNV